MNFTSRIPRVSPVATTIPPAGADRLTILRANITRADQVRALHTQAAPDAPPAPQRSDLNRDGESFFLQASMKVSVPGVDRAVAQELAEAVHGNIEVSTNVI
jgi:organic hydroperoxide reductase OsmC/OhrA